LIERIREAVPIADFSDPSRGQIVTADFAIEVTMGRDEIVDSIMLHVRGGDTAVGLIGDLLDRPGRRAIDCRTGEFFDVETASESIAAWRAFRNRAVGSTG
jgi:hypothetical protein